MVSAMAIVFVLYFLINHAAAQLTLVPPSVGRCDWVKDIGNPETLAQHQYIALEDCLYYNLSAQADAKFKKFNSLYLLPPMSNPGDQILVNIQETQMRALAMSDWASPQLTGSMFMSWKDNRFTWDSDVWKLDRTKIRSFFNVWLPDINADRREPLATGDTITFQNISATKTGNLSVRMDFKLMGHCVYDYSSYPTDTINCCFDFQSILYPKVIQYNVLNTDGILKYDRNVVRWNVLSFTVKPETRDDGSSRLNACMSVTRQSSTIRMELTLPMAICALLVVVSPLFGSMLNQVYAKMFALLLQFLCFQFMVNKTPAAGFGNTIPKIYKFAEFTLATTMVSLILTLILRMCSNCERKIPPPHSLQLMSNVLNKKLCCNNKDEGGEIRNESEPTKQNAGWKDVFEGINNLLSFLLIIIYIIAAFILCF